MKISKTQLQKEAAFSGFRAEILEKVYLLMNVLDGINAHPFLKERLVLKGGTALNLFVFDLPRLSVDIDLNYIGGTDRSTMLSERPQIERALEAVCQRENMMIRRAPQKHAGGKWLLRYESAFTPGGNLEIDVNYMFRLPLWEIQKRPSVVVGGKTTGDVAVLDQHELAAGKLTALFARTASRDLFDAYQLLTQTGIDWQKLRLAFLLYGAMSSKDWRIVTLDEISFDEVELKRRLFPVLREREIGRSEGCGAWANTMVKECRKALEKLLPFADNELEFLNRLSEEGEITAALLTDDLAMQSTIQAHPLLEWKAKLAKKIQRG